MNIEFIEGEAPTDEYGCLVGEYILKNADGRLFAVGSQNSEGGVCNCCSHPLPKHVAYAKIGDSE